VRFMHAAQIEMRHIERGQLHYRLRTNLFSPFTWQGKAEAAGIKRPRLMAGASLSPGAQTQFPERCDGRKRYLGKSEFGALKLGYRIQQVRPLKANANHYHNTGTGPFRNQWSLLDGRGPLP
jgi:hypothetical protein